MFYEFSRINNLKKRCELALHNAKEMAKGVYPTPEQFLQRCKFSFVKNIAARDLIQFCGEQLIIDLNESSYDQMMTLVLFYLQDYGVKDICAVTVLKDMLQAARPFE